LRVFEQVQEWRPDVVVLDITMPGLNGLDVCREIRNRLRDVKVLILSMHDDEEFIARALQNGASGYLFKDGAAKQLREAVRTIAGGGVYLGLGVPGSVLQQLNGRAQDAYETLTTRERQVLQLIAEGRTSRKIAEELSLAVKTVDTHRSRLMQKLHIHDQTSLVKYALRKGIVPLR
jgi:DNA-binding NarL/FixJ family response regulator